MARTEIIDDREVTYIEVSLDDYNLKSADIIKLHNERDELIRQRDALLEACKMALWIRNHIEGHHGYHYQEWDIVIAAIETCQPNAGNTRSV